MYSLSVLFISNLIKTDLRNNEMDEFLEIDDLTDVEYENLAKDYEANELPIKEIVDKYGLNPIYKKRGLFQQLKKFIKSEKECPNCGELLYRPVRSRNEQYQRYNYDDYICKSCGHFNDEDRCECDLCKGRRKEREDRINAQLESLKLQEEKRIAERLFRESHIKRRINSYLKSKTNQERYFNFEELTLKQKIFVSCICSKLKLIDQTGVLVSLDNQDPIALKTIFPRQTTFNQWLTESIQDGIISISPSSSPEAFNCDDDIVRYDITKVNLKIMVNELNDPENYHENLEKIKNLNYSFGAVNYDEIKQLWADIGAQEIIVFMLDKMTSHHIFEFNNTKFTTVVPDIIEGEKYTLSLFIQNGLSIGQVLNVTYAAISNAALTEDYKTFIAQRALCSKEDYLELDIPKQLLINDIQCRISNYGAANLSGKKITNI